MHALTVRNTIAEHYAKGSLVWFRKACLNISRKNQQPIIINNNSSGLHPRMPCWLRTNEVPSIWGMKGGWMRGEGMSMSFDLVTGRLEMLSLVVDPWKNSPFGIKVSIIPWKCHQSHRVSNSVKGGLIEPFSNAAYLSSSVLKRGLNSGPVLQ